ncbi:MAG: hypothetical protein HYZ28_16975 [Myxococcales bacterium]|nr:hypothetical protein [Myxococcales bacterium]
MKSAVRWWVLLGLVAWPAAAEPVAHHFDKAPLSSLTLVHVQPLRGRTPSAAVEDPRGQVIIVRQGDFISRDRLRIQRVSRGCLDLVTESGEGHAMLCIEQAQSPRS